MAARTVSAHDAPAAGQGLFDGLSIYCYTYAKRTIGAARTSTYYALAPFIGADLSFLLLGEPLTPLFLVATAVMAAGCWLATKNDC